MPKRDGETGRFVPEVCNHQNCDGDALLAGESPFHAPEWHCNGLTTDHEYGNLRACFRSYPRSLNVPEKSNG